MKASLIFYPNESKQNLKTGKIPIYMRICFQRSKSESRLNIELSKGELGNWDPITMRLQERNSSINHYLNRLEQKFQDFLLANVGNMTNFCASDIKSQVWGVNKTKSPTVMTYIDKYFANNVVNNVNRTPGTIKNYRRAINHLINFLKIRKQDSILLEQLKVDTANDFKNYLVNTDPAMKRVGMTEVSAAGVIKKFRTIFSQAVDEELIKSNPFKKVKIKTKSPRRERLNIEQVNKICQLDLKLYPYQDLYRDIFLFSVYTGLAYHDATALTWRNFENRSDGNIKLTVRRQKTDVITECFLPKLAVEILEKYKAIPEVEIANRVLPYRSNKEINSQLKLLAQMASIQIRLTTHIARHTFRQLIAEAGIGDYGVIKRMMGQSRNGDVDEVYYSITERALLDAKIKMDQLLME